MATHDTSLAAALAFDATVASARAQRIRDRPYPRTTEPVEPVADSDNRNAPTKTPEESA